MIDRDRAISLLPAFWHAAARTEDTPTAALVDEMVAMLRPVECWIESFDSMLDPHRSEEAMLPFLAAMSGLGALLPHWRSATAADMGRLRALLVAWPDLRRRRGEAGALLRAMRLVFGVEPGLEERPGFHLRIELDAAIRPQAALAREIVRLMTPAHLTCEIGFRQGETERPPRPPHRPPREGSA